jgi:hypothetical protein
MLALEPYPTAPHGELTMTDVCQTRRMHAWLCASLSAVLLALSPTDLVAQFAEVQPGARVRLRAPGVVAGRYTGVVLSRSADSMTVSRAAGSAVVVPMRAVTSLELSRGKSRAVGAGKGALWGGGSMGLLFAALPGSVKECQRTTSGTRCTNVSVGEAMLVGAAGGAVWGALIGALIGAERWERAELPVRVVLMPGLDGRGVQAMIRVGMP